MIGLWRAGDESFQKSASYWVKYCTVGVEEEVGESCYGRGLILDSSAPVCSTGDPSASMVRARGVVVWCIGIVGIDDCHQSPPLLRRRENCWRV